MVELGLAACISGAMYAVREAGESSETIGFHKDEEASAGSAVKNKHHVRAETHIP